MNKFTSYVYDSIPIDGKLALENMRQMLWVTAVFKVPQLTITATRQNYNLPRDVIWEIVQYADYGLACALARTCKEVRIMVLGNITPNFTQVGHWSVISDDSDVVGISSGNWTLQVAKVGLLELFGCDSLRLFSHICMSEKGRMSPKANLNFMTLRISALYGCFQSSDAKCRINFCISCHRPRAILSLTGKSLSAYFRWGDCLRCGTADGACNVELSSAAIGVSQGKSTVENILRGANMGQIVELILGEMASLNTKLVQ